MNGAVAGSATLSRRGFLKLGAAVGAGLAIGCSLRDLVQAAPRRPPDGEGGFRPGDPALWVRVTPDDLVTVVLPRCEMGQGISTALPMLVAEELEAEWSRVRTEWAPLAPEYGRQLTAASDGVRTFWEPLRQAGALAREMLLTAAASAWGVDRAECRAERGRVLHPPSGRSATYGALADAAARLSIPREVPLKPSRDFRLIGTPVPRLDVPDKATGRAVYGWDVRLPGLLVASVLHSPVHGGTLKGFDARKAEAVAGVRRVVPLGSARGTRWTAIAVVADGFWSAHRGLQALDLEWDGGEYGAASTATIAALLRELAKERGTTVVYTGTPREAMGRATRRLGAVYETPYLAHVTMEPMSCTARVSGHTCELWVPTQNPTEARAVAARICHLPTSAITVHQTYLGGGFGRRQRVDAVAEAVQLAKMVGAPVKVLWSREEDTRSGYYRPATLHQLSAGLDQNGLPIAWMHRVAGVGGSVTLLVQGIDAVPYEIPHQRVTLVRRPRGPVRTGPWRGLARSQNAFATECFLDEVAGAGGIDPVTLRLRLLSRAPRYQAVLELAAQRAGWGVPRAPGRHLGVALAENFGSICAQVAEVSTEGDGTVRVHRVVCALDCGQIVNPDIVTAQVEGGIVFGLSAALAEEITMEHGRVQQTNFHDYPVLRLPDAPRIEVHLVSSEAPPGGVGETAVPPVAPAVVNALFAATGTRVRTLPIRRVPPSP